MKRSFLLSDGRAAGVLASGAGLIAATYGLVRLAYGLFLPDVRTELAFSATTAGLVSAGASVVYCVGALVGFVGAARHPRVLVLAALLSAATGAAGMAAAPHTGAFAVFAILGSAGAGLASPALVTIVARNPPDGADARRQAVVNAGTGPGLVAAGLLALVLLPNWRLAWFVVAAFTVVVGTAVLVLDRRDGHREPDRAASRALPPRSWFWQHRHVVLAAFLLGAGSAAVWNFGRTHLAEAGVSDESSVAAWVALGVGGTAVIGTARRMSALAPRTVWTITTATAAAATAALGLIPNATVAVLVVCAAFGWGYTAGTGALIAWTSAIDPARAPTGTSLLFVVLVLGQAVGAVAVGMLMSPIGAVGAFTAATAVTVAAAVAPLVWRSIVRSGPEQDLSEHRVRG